MNTPRRMLTQALQHCSVRSLPRIGKVFRSSTLLIMPTMVIMLSSVRSNPLIAQCVQDGNFGTGGLISITAMIGCSTFDGVDVAVRPDGRILVAGGADTGSTHVFAVVQLLSDGTLDASFGTNGAALIDVTPNSLDLLRNMVLCTDGKIMLFGTSIFSDPFHSNESVVRLLDNGHPDPGFGTDGILITSAPDLSRAVVDDQGHMTMCGAVDHNGTFQPGVFRLGMDGNADTSFGVGQGTAVDPWVPCVIGDYVDLIALNNGNLMAVGGYSTCTPGPSGGVYGLYTSDGTAAVNSGLIDAGCTFHVQAVTQAPDERIITGGTDCIHGSMCSWWFDGQAQMDTTLYVTFMDPLPFPHPVASSCSDVLVDAMGRTLLIGTAGGSGTDRLALCRLLTDGALDPSFSEDGTLITSLPSGQASVRAALQNDDTILALYGHNVARFTVTDISTAVVAPTGHTTLGVFPNPARDRATLAYELGVGGKVTMRILDATGRSLVAPLVDVEREPGMHQEVFALDTGFPAGAYIVQLIGPDGMRCTKLVVE